MPTTLLHALALAVAVLVMKISNSENRAAVCLLLLLLSLAGAGCTKVTSQDVAGTYVRSSSGLTETLELNPDGSFRQTVILGTNSPVSLTDVWTNKYKKVTFYRLYITYDVEHKRQMDPPDLVHYANLGWEPGLLIKSEDSAYVFRKREP